MLLVLFWLFTIVNASTKISSTGNPQFRVHSESRRLFTGFNYLTRNHGCFNWILIEKLEKLYDGCQLKLAHCRKGTLICNICDVEECMDLSTEIRSFPLYLAYDCFKETIMSPYGERIQVHNYLRIKRELTELYDYCNQVKVCYKFTDQYTVIASRAFAIRNLNCTETPCQRDCRLYRQSFLNIDDSNVNVECLHYVSLSKSSLEENKKIWRSEELKCEALQKAEEKKIAEMAKNRNTSPWMVSEGYSSKHRIDFLFVFLTFGILILNYY